VWVVPLALLVEDRFLDDFDVVEPVFQRIFASVWLKGEEDGDALAKLPREERAIYTTRILEGQLDNGGWYQVFGNGVDHLLEPAIDGYELLGLADYASHLREVRAVGFNDGSPDEIGEALDGAYFRLSGSEAARAHLIRSDGLIG
jgi:hypothetical protein